MKIASVLSAIAIGVVGCGPPAEEQAGLTRELTAAPATCRSLSLTASRQYHPTRSQDGSQSFAPAFSLAIPDRIAVAAGRAGDATHQVRLAITSGSQVDTCVYAGANRGTRYHFSSCGSGRS